MPCTPGVTLPVPTLPGGISITPTIPDPDFDLTLCCKLLQFSPGAALPPFGIPLNPALFAAITSTLQSIQDYLDAIPLKCPRE